MERHVHGEGLREQEENMKSVKRLPRFLPRIRNYVPHDVVTFYFGYFSPYI